MYFDNHCKFRTCCVVYWNLTHPKKKYVKKEEMFLKYKLILPSFFRCWFLYSKYLSLLFVCLFVPSFLPPSIPLSLHCFLDKPLSLILAYLSKTRSIGERSDRSSGVLWCLLGNSVPSWTHSLSAQEKWLQNWVWVY